MYKKRFAKIVVACGIALLLAACSTHRKPQVTGVADGNGMYGDKGAETYTNGADGSYAENCKCRPAPVVPGTEQRYFFDFDSFDVRQEFMESIKVQADYLVKHPNIRIRLEGNTDDRGSREYNVALGERRARAVIDLLKQYGVHQSQVTIVSFGAEKPAALGEDEQSYQCNRRVDLKYTCD